MPKVSVIIPVYNAEKYLPKCLDSVVKQTLKDIEILCIDDGSVDNSGKILDKYAKKDKRIRVIHKQNEGLSVTRNLGIKEAKGKYIGFIDADDWISLDFYKKLYNEAEKYDADVSITSIYRAYSATDGKNLVDIQDYMQADTLLEKFALASLPEDNYVVNKIYKTEFLRKNKLYFIPGIYFEDMRWSPPVIEKASKVVTVPGGCYFYFAHEDEIIVQTNNDFVKYKDMMASRKWLKAYLRKKKIPYSGKMFDALQKRTKWNRLQKTKYTLFGFIPLLSIEEE